MTKKRATMREIAELAGVSRTTVSFVLNQTPNTNIPEETRERVIKIARQLNYVANAKAINLVTGRTQTLALVVRQTNHHLPVQVLLNETLCGLTQVLAPSGYHCIVIPDTSSSDYVQLARSQKVDGLIISEPILDDPMILTLYDEGIPIVLMGTMEGDPLPSIDIDMVKCAVMAVEHLIALGHTRVAHITHGPLTYAAARGRLAGYRNALAAANIPFDDALVQEGDFIDESGYQAMQILLDLPERPTAVFAGSDTIALGAISAIHHQHLKIPDDISVVGFDDIPLISHLDPGLTTIHLPALELGWHAGRILLALIAGEPLQDIHIRLDTMLIIRDSTSAPPS